MMFTPSSIKRSKRLQTTVDHSHRMTTQTMAELLSEKEDLSVMYRDIEPLRQKLFDSGEKTQQFQRYMPMDPEEVQRNYRKKMMNYLDTKFSEAAGNISPQKSKIKIKRSEYKLTVVNVAHVKNIFKEYLSVLREWNIKTLTQYWLGVVLRELNFIRNMLEERDLITEIWKNLKEPTWIELFVFISELYFHRNTHKNSVYQCSYTKEELTGSIVQVLKEEGRNCTLKSIQKAYDLVSSSLISYACKLALLNNRQNRPTCSSWSRSTSRRKS